MRMVSPSWIEGQFEFSASTAAIEKGRQELGIPQSIANSIAVLSLKRTPSLVGLPPYYSQSRVVRHRHNWKHPHSGTRAHTRYAVPVLGPDLQLSQDSLLAPLGSRCGRTQGHCGAWTVEPDLHSGPVEGHSRQDGWGSDLDHPTAYLVPRDKPVVCRR